MMDNLFNYDFINIIISGCGWMSCFKVQKHGSDMCDNQSSTCSGNKKIVFKCVLPLTLRVANKHLRYIDRAACVLGSYKFVHRESGWQSGKELDFYPSNPGSTPARVPTTKKRDHQSVPFMTSSRKAYLQISKKIVSESGSIKTNWCKCAGVNISRILGHRKYSYKHLL